MMETLRGGGRGGNATIIADVDRRPLSIVLGSVHSKSVEDGCMVVTTKTFFWSFY